MSRPERARAGLLNIDKPPGMTSRAVVDRVARLVRPAKVGHAGTLDPLATGVLVVAVGSATRLVEYVQRMRKKYRATFLFGRTSTTEDIEGAVVELADPPRPTLAQVAKAARAFTGELLQRPPAFSALKVGGQRAHRLARAGRDVVLEPRQVTVDRCDVVRYEYPELRLDVVCSGGTYVRSLGRDLAESLGTGAVMSALVRTAIGAFVLEDAVALESLSAETLGGCLLPPRVAVRGLPVCIVAGDALERIRHGRAFAARLAADAQEGAAVDDEGNLVALVVPVGDGRLKPTRVFLA